MSQVRSSGQECAYGQCAFQCKKARRQSIVQVPSKVARRRPTNSGIQLQFDLHEQSNYPRPCSASSTHGPLFDNVELHAYRERSNWPTFQHDIPTRHSNADIPTRTFQREHSNADIPTRSDFCAQFTGKVNIIARTSHLKKVVRRATWPSKFCIYCDNSVQ